MQLRDIFIDSGEIPEFFFYFFFIPKEFGKHLRSWFSEESEFIIPLILNKKMLEHNFKTSQSCWIWVRNKNKKTSQSGGKQNFAQLQKFQK